MNAIPSRALAISGPFITTLIAINTIYALCIAVLLVATVVAPWFRPGWPWEPLGFTIDGAHPRLSMALQSIAFLGLAGAGLVHLVLRGLRAIVDTVRDGDPFIADNAHRLLVFAWSVLAGEILRLLIVGIAAVVSTPAQRLHMGDALSFTPWLAVLLLFVLAGVFAQGARMRADLEGIV